MKFFYNYLMIQVVYIVRTTVCNSRKVSLKIGLFISKSYELCIYIFQKTGIIFFPIHVHDEMHGNVL